MTSLRRGADDDLVGCLIQLLVAHIGRVVQLLEYELRVAVIDALLIQIDVEQIVDRSVRVMILAHVMLLLGISIIILKHTLT